MTLVIIWGTLGLCAAACVACIWLGAGLDSMAHHERAHFEDKE